MTNYHFNRVAKGPDWHNRFLDLAKHISTWSKDPSTKVGAVIVNDKKQIVGMGYNGFPRGIEDSKNNLTNRKLKYKMVIHAEENAILNATSSVEGCTIYVWPFMPCSTCAAKLIQVGIKRVVAPETNRTDHGFQVARDMFNEAGVILREEEH